MNPNDYFIRELIEDEDIIFNKDSDYHKQRKKEKKNPIFKRNNSKKVRRSQIETIHRNMDSTIRWIEYLAEYPD